ncbi:Uncharacterised protein [Enterobacter cloacae]|nr:Uncharacterised protein [Enterobacter cloacae]
MKTLWVLVLISSVVLLAHGFGLLLYAPYKDWLLMAKDATPEMVVFNPKPMFILSVTGLVIAASCLYKKN